MKTLQNCRQRLYTIPAACLGILFAACGHANADGRSAEYTPPAPATTVTGSGINTVNAFLQDTTTTTPYTVTITAGSDLELTGSAALPAGNTNGNEIQFLTGSVTNNGILNADNTNGPSENIGVLIGLGDGVSFGGGSVVNFGSINGENIGVEIDGSGSVVNNGVINGSGQAAVFSDIDNTGPGANNTFSLVNNFFIGNPALPTSIGVFVIDENDATTDAGADSNTVTITNNGTVLTNEDDDGILVGLVANTDNATAVSDTNTVTVTNNEVISLLEGGNGIDALDAPGIFNTGNAVAGTNIVNVTNAFGASITTPEGVGIGLDVYNEGNDGPGINTNTVNVENDGLLTIGAGEDPGDGGPGQGIVLEVVNEGNGDETGDVNMVNVTNTGSILATNEGIDLDEVLNAENDSPGTNIVTVTNTNSIVATSSDNGRGSEFFDNGRGIYIDSVDNRFNDGDGVNTNTVTVSNGGTITSEGYGIGLHHVSNYTDEGTGSNTVTIVNSGVIDASDEAEDATDGTGIYTEKINNEGLGTDGLDSNTVTVVNSGVINAEDDGIELSGIYNGDSFRGNAGFGSNTVTVTNTGVINSGSETDDVDNDGTGIHVDVSNADNTDEEDNGGDDTNTVTIYNSGTVAAFEDGVDVFTSNEDNENVGDNDNMVELVNTGSIVSSNEDGVDIENDNDNDNGDTDNENNTVLVVNSGVIAGRGESGENGGNGGNGDTGLLVENSNEDAVGNSTNSIEVINSGTITSGTDGNAVVLDNEDTDTEGSSTNTIQVVNTASGSMVGTAAGLIISNESDNDPEDTFNSAYVWNAGTILGGGVGILSDTDNATIWTQGGLIGGGFSENADAPTDDAIFLGGNNSTVTVYGRTLVQGQIDGASEYSGISGGTVGVGNKLIFDLAGITPGQMAYDKGILALSALDPDVPFTIVAANYTYTFVGFDPPVLNPVSFEQNVDSGLGDLATKLDNTSLPTLVNGKYSYDLVYSDGYSNPEATLNTLSGREFLDAFTQIGLSNSTALSELGDGRAFDLRAGASGMDFSRMNINPSTMIASLGDTQSTLSHLSSSAAFGGTTMSDSKEAKTMVTAPPSPLWGAWISGTVTFADESSTNTNPGYNATSGSPTIGVDYRVCPDLVLGALFNYTTGSVDFNDGSNLDTDSYLGGLYADWAHGPWFINALAGGGVTDYDQTRVTLPGADANASPTGDEVVLSLDGGYDFKIDGWVLSPEVGLVYTYLTKDAYSETGADAYDLNVAEDDVNSLRTKLGFRATHLFTCSSVKFTPQVNAAWYHECLDDTNNVSESLAGAPAFGSFNITTNPEGRDFAVVGAGLSATPADWHENVSFFVNYDAQVGQDNFLGQTVDGGVRVNF